MLVVCFFSWWVGSPALAQKKSTTAKQKNFRVVCWNVLYGFNHHKSVKEGVQWLAKQQPDVVALQELNGNTAKSLAKLAKQWGHGYSAILKENGFPVGLTSKQPIEVIERRVKGFHHGYLHCKTSGVHFFVVHFWPGKDHEAAHVLKQIQPLHKQDRRSCPQLRKFHLGNLSVQAIPRHLWLGQPYRASSLLLLLESLRQGAFHHD